MQTKQRLENSDKIAFERTSSYEDSEGPGLARKEDCTPYSGNKVPLKLPVRPYRLSSPPHAAVQRHATCHLSMIPFSFRNKPTAFFILCKTYDLRCCMWLGASRISIEDAGKALALYSYSQYMVLLATSSSQDSCLTSEHGFG